MLDPTSFTAHLQQQGISRRSFMKFCATTASLLALPPSVAPALAAALEQMQRRSVIWLSFQECTGCTEALTRSHAPSLETLLFEFLSLDYHHTLQAASGTAAEQAREQAMQEHWGRYLLVVDGSIPTGNPGYSTIAGLSNLSLLKQTAQGAAAIIAVGTCAAFGGLPKAAPNPTGAVAVRDIIQDKPIINISGCPPIPAVITGVLAHILAFGQLPALDEYRRPQAFFGQSIHDRCYRRPFYDRGLFAERFDDAGAKAGWCLYRLGCKGPMTYNACATLKWNGGVSWPVEAGHPCLGCAEPDFWDAGSFYQAVSIPAASLTRVAGYAATAGVVLGVASGVSARQQQRLAIQQHLPITANELIPSP